MAPTANISTLHKHRNDWEIRVNIFRVWINSLTEDICFIVNDAMGNRIGGIMSSSHVDKYHEFINREGYWCTIQNFDLIDAPIVGKTTAHDYQIVMNDETNILNWVADENKNRFLKFVTVQDIVNHDVSAIYPIDLIGALTNVGPIQLWSYAEGMPNPWFMRSYVTFTIKDEGDRVMNGVAYATHAEELSNKWKNWDVEFATCVFKSIRIKRDSGIITLDVDPGRSVIEFQPMDIPKASYFETRYLYRYEGVPSDLED